MHVYMQLASCIELWIKLALTITEISESKSALLSACRGCHFSINSMLGRENSTVLIGMNQLPKQHVVWDLLEHSIHPKNANDIIFVEAIAPYIHQICLEMCECQLQWCQRPTPEFLTVGACADEVGQWSLDFGCSGIGTPGTWRRISPFHCLGGGYGKSHGGCFWCGEIQRIQREVARNP